MEPFLRIYSAEGQSSSVNNRVTEAEVDEARKTIAELLSSARGGN